nr:sigma-54 dependent transcriptional regulator [uncultured Desulfobulbus sp.]
MNSERGEHREVLVVDDDHYLLAAIQQTLALNGYTAKTYTNPVEALAGVTAQDFAAVIADIRMPEMNGMELLARIRAHDADLPVILITGHGDISMAVEAVKQGAYHFLQKPVDEEMILATLARAIERRQLVLDKRHLEEQLQASRAGRSRFYGIIGSHPLMRGLYTLIEAVADEPDPVLISGETGTGKELVARAIHESGERRTRPYVAVNMGAIPSEMIESELFGHERGAFTGAIQRKVGKFEFAGEGTLFLDEICSMPASLQSKLLRVIEDRTFSRVGSNAVLPLKARIIAATNRDLKVEIERGSFRQDLFFRLNVLPVHLPALRERKEDIPQLVEFFWKEYCGGAQGEEVGACPGELIDQLVRRDWPGNIRELRNVVRRTCVLGDAQPVLEQGDAKEDSTPLQGAHCSLRAFMEQQEKRYLEQILAQTGGQITLAHKILKISRKSLYDKINKYRLDLDKLRKGRSGSLGE